jgi:hypothetical protein
MRPYLHIQSEGRRSRFPDAIRTVRISPWRGASRTRWKKLPHLPREITGDPPLVNPFPRLTGDVFHSLLRRRANGIGARADSDEDQASHL